MSAWIEDLLPDRITWALDPGARNDLLDLVETSLIADGFIPGDPVPLDVLQQTTDEALYALDGGAPRIDPARASEYRRLWQTTLTAIVSAKTAHDGLVDQTRHLFTAMTRMSPAAPYVSAYAVVGDATAMYVPVDDAAVTQSNLVDLVMRQVRVDGDETEARQAIQAILTDARSGTFNPARFSQQDHDANIGILVALLAAYVTPLAETMSLDVIGMFADLATSVVVKEYSGAAVDWATSKVLVLAEEPQTLKTAVTSAVNALRSLTLRANSRAGVAAALAEKRAREAMTVMGILTRSFLPLTENLHADLAQWTATGGPVPSAVDAAEPVLTAARARRLPDTARLERVVAHLRDTDPDLVADATGFNAHVAAALYGARPHVADADLCSVLVAAAPSMPDQPLLEWDPISPSGLLWLAHPISVGTITIHGFVWSTTVTNVQHPRHGIAIVPIVRNPFANAAGAAALADIPFTLDPRISFWAFGETFADFHDRVRGSVPYVSVFRALAAFWSTTRIPLTLTEQHDCPDPRARKLARRAGTLPDDGITVIRLRHALPDRPDGDTSDLVVTDVTTGQTRKVNWRNRWIVKGHWKGQWYPSLGVHRQIWIAPYLKGPDGKPIKSGDKVWVAAGKDLLAPPEADDAA